MEYLYNILSSPLTSIIVSFATLIALTLAIFESIVSKKRGEQLKEVSINLESHHEKLHKIGQSLSTQVIGVFPEYLPDIAYLLSRARKQVLIMCAYPQHGAFSNPKGWHVRKRNAENYQSR